MSKHGVTVHLHCGQSLLSEMHAEIPETDPMDTLHLAFLWISKKLESAAVHVGTKNPDLRVHLAICPLRTKKQKESWKRVNQLYGVEPVSISSGELFTTGD